MEYVYGTSVIGGVERENLKIVGGPALREGEYLTTVREYDDSSITDRCRIDRHYHSDTDEDGTRYDFYTISEHYRYVERTKLMEETRKATEIAFVTLAADRRCLHGWAATQLGEQAVQMRTGAHLTGGMGTGQGGVALVGGI